MKTFMQGVSIVDGTKHEGVFMQGTQRRRSQFMSQCAMRPRVTYTLYAFTGTAEGSTVGTIAVLRQLASTRSSIVPGQHDLQATAQQATVWRGQASRLAKSGNLEAFPSGCATLGAWVDEYRYAQLCGSTNQFDDDMDNGSRTVVVASALGTELAVLASAQCCQ